MSAIDPTAIPPGHAADAGPAHEDPGHDHAHPPHLQHHFDTPEQQFDASKLGMWAFLATEVLMFGGLFCAYAVYRYNNPDVFRYGEHHVSTFWGALNTILLLTSSLTMAMGVRAAQLGQRSILIVMLILTLMGGAGFMVIKTIEYTDKWNHGLFPGLFNRYDRIQNEAAFVAAMTGDHGEGEHAASEDHDAATDHGEGEPGEAQSPGGVEHQEPGEAETHATGPSTGPATQPGTDPATAPAEAPPPDLTYLGPGYRDPNYGSPDVAKVRPSFQTPAGIAAHESAERASVQYADLTINEQANVKAFFNIYFLMTGLHGLHVLIGIGLITWILVKSVNGVFGPAYFTPVDLVGLYWHLVDLIWIFLFPLLYLIH